jgi:hypothetical protein
MLLGTYEPMVAQWCKSVMGGVVRRMAYGPYAQWPEGDPALLIVTDGALDLANVPGDANIAHIIRHPGDTLALNWSLTMKIKGHVQTNMPRPALGGMSIQEWLQSKPNKRTSINAAIDIWAPCMTVMQAWRADPRVLDIRYEDLYADRGGTMRIMAEHLGIGEDYDLDELEARANNEKIGHIKRHRRPRSLDGLGAPKTWSTVLHQNNIDHLEETCPGLVEDLGYDWVPESTTDSSSSASLGAE